MAYKRISITAPEEDINYCKEKMINKSHLFQRAVKKLRDDKNDK